MLPKENNSNQHLIKAVKAGELGIFENFYKDLRPIFLNWAFKHYQLEESIAGDLFQQSMLQLYENILQGKLDKLQGTVEGYCYGIAKNIQLNMIRHQKVKTKHQESLGRHIMHLKEANHTEEQQEIRETVRLVFHNLKAPCKKILRLFYYEQKKASEISQLLDYQNEQVVRTQKSRCLKYLRKLVKAARRTKTTS